MIKVFIDGSVGTTGLRIHERLANHPNLEVITLPEELRKDLDARVKIANTADLVFLCLPDVAAKEIAAKINKTVKVCDTSTAHRTNDDWTYGFAEVGARREKLKSSTRTAVPGCHASGFIALIAPLVENGVLAKTALLTATSITGYSGGGKAMIAQYQAEQKPVALTAPRTYGLALSHKHLPEICKITGLENAPIFVPVVADFYSGMYLTIPLFAQNLMANADATKVYETIKAYYENEKAVVVQPFGKLPEDGFAAANELSGKDSMNIYVYAKDEQILLTAVYDNLGKGASGAAVQCMNVMLGLDEYTGLVL